MTPEVIRDLIYKDQKKLLLDMHRVLDKARICDAPVDLVSLETLKSYLLKQHPLWFISGHYQAYGSSYYEVPSQFRQMLESEQNFLNTLIEKGSNYLKYAKCPGTSWAHCSGKILRLIFENMAFVDRPEGSLEITFDGNGSCRMWNSTCSAGELNRSTLIYDFKRNKPTSHIHLGSDDSKVLAAKSLRCVARLLGDPDFFEKYISDDKFHNKL